MSNDAACMVINVNTPKVITDPISTGLRPNTSASQPPRIAPITRPMLLAESACPSTSRDSFSSGPSDGAATPIAWMSKPSITMTAKHSVTVSHVPLREGHRDTRHAGRDGQHRPRRRAHGAS